MALKYKPGSPTYIASPHPAMFAVIPGFNPIPENSQRVASSGKSGSKSDNDLLGKMYAHDFAKMQMVEKDLAIAQQTYQTLSQKAMSEKLSKDEEKLMNDALKTSFVKENELQEVINTGKLTYDYQSKLFQKMDERSSSAVLVNKAPGGGYRTIPKTDVFTELKKPATYSDLQGMLSSNAILNPREIGGEIVDIPKANQEFKADFDVAMKAENSDYSSFKKYMDAWAATKTTSNTEALNALVSAYRTPEGKALWGKNEASFYSEYAGQNILGYDNEGNEIKKKVRANFKIDLSAKESVQDKNGKLILTPEDAVLMNLYSSNGEKITKENVRDYSEKDIAGRKEYTFEDFMFDKALVNSNIRKSVTDLFSTYDLEKGSDDDFDMNLMARLETPEFRQFANSDILTQYNKENAEQALYYKGIEQMQKSAIERAVDNVTEETIDNYVNSKNLTSDEKSKLKKSLQDDVANVRSKINEIPVIGAIGIGKVIGAATGSGFIELLTPFMKFAGTKSPMGKQQAIAPMNTNFAQNPLIFEHYNVGYNDVPDAPTDAVYHHNTRFESLNIMINPDDPIKLTSKDAYLVKKINKIWYNVPPSTAKINDNKEGRDLLEVEMYVTKETLKKIAEQKGGSISFKNISGESIEIIDRKGNINKNVSEDMFQKVDQSELDIIANDNVNDHHSKEALRMFGDDTVYKIRVYTDKKPFDDYAASIDPKKDRKAKKEVVKQQNSR